LSARLGVLFLVLVVLGLGVRPVNAADAGSAARLSKRIAAEESRSGPASPQLLPLLERLAGAQFDDGALAAAAASRRRAMRIALHNYGGQSVNTAHAMVALADVELLRQRYTEAEGLLTAALPTLEARNGPESTALIGPLASLARIALARGELQAARSLASRANTIVLRHPKIAATEPMRVLGTIAAAQDHVDDGERMLRAAVERDRKTHGASSLEAARSLAQLGTLLLRAQRYEQALAPIQEAIAIDQQRLGPLHPLIADDFADLGLIYAGLGRDDAAAAMMYYAIDLLERGSSSENPRIGYLELDLAPVVRRLGEPDEADSLFDDAKHILDSAADEEKKHERLS
jgi:tetratricopeptide (TPR) repeat protein